jgi:hypothetical protein
VTYLLRALITEAKETAVATQWFYKHVSKAVNSRDRGNDYADNNRGIVGSGVLCWVGAEAI